MPHTALHDTVAARLRPTRQRYTLGRQQLVELLAETDRPLTIPELLDEGVTQSQSSLYRNLSVLEQAGAVHRLIGLDDVARFELAEDVTGEHHHHLVCTSCGVVEDIELPGELEKALHDTASDVGDDHRFAVDSHHVELHGHCRDCA